ncbi:MAG: AlpA family phage regulatory protein [Haliea sp.]
MVDKILSTGEVLEHIPYSRIHLWRMVKAGSFPAPIQLTERKIGFRESDVEAWLDSRPTVEYAPTASEAEA